MISRAISISLTCLWLLHFYCNENTNEEHSAKELWQQNLVPELSGTSAVESMSNSCRKINCCLKFNVKLHFKQPCVLSR